MKYKTKEQKADLHKQLVKWLSNCETSTAETIWQENASEDYKFYAGDQDTPEVKALLAAAKRPTSVFNEIKPKIDMLVGMSAQLDGAVGIFPKGAEDGPLIELLNGTLDHFRKLMRMGRKEIKCFEHTVKSGKSYLHFYADLDDKYCPIKCQRIPARFCHRDPDSVEDDMSDTRYFFRDKWLDLSDIEEFWDKFKFPRDTAGNVIGGSLESVPEKHAYTPSFFNEANDKYRIVECWWKTYETLYTIQNPLTGEEENIYEESFLALKKSLKEGIELPDGNVIQQDELESVQRRVQVLYMAIITANEILEVSRNTYNHGTFPYIPLEAYHDEDNNCALSVINAMKDPQMGLNTTRRQLIHLLQTSPKGILMHEAGAVLNIEDYEENSSKPNFHMELSSGGLQKIKFSQQPQIPQIYSNLDGLFQQSMKDSSGIQDSLLGIQTSTREPGITARMRNESAVAVLYTLFDNYKEFKFQSTKMLLSLIQQYVTEEMVIRIKGPEGMRLMEINSQVNPEVEGFNDISVAKYDVEIDEEVVTKSTRLAVAELLTEFGHNNPGSVPPDLLMEYAGLPYSSQLRVREHMAQQAEMAREESERDYELRVAEINAKQKKGGSE